MSPSVATIVCIAGIAALFALDRESNARVSKALWIPFVWLLLSTSRPASAWLVVFGFKSAAAPNDAPDYYYLDGSPIDRKMLFCLLAIGIVVLAGRWRQVGKLLLNNKLLLVFFFYCALSIFWSDYTFVAFKRWIKSLGDLVFVLMVFTDLQPAVAVRRLLTRAGFVLVPLSVLFVKYYGDLGRMYNPWTFLPAYTGVTENKNELGMLCLIFGVGSVWCLLDLIQSRTDTHRARRMLSHCVLLAMVFWLFWMADSVTSIACFSLAAAVMIATSFRVIARRPVVVLMLVAGVIGIAFYALFLSSGMVESLGRDPTLTGRTVIWDVVLSVRGNAVVGTGFESFWMGRRLHKVWELTMTGLQEAHNGYLELFLNLGWIGVMLLAGLIVNGYRNIMAAFRRDRAMANLKLAFFVVAIVYNFTEAGFRETTLVWIFFLLATFDVPRMAAPKAQLRPEVTPSSELSEFLLQADPVLAPEPASNSGLANYQDFSESKNLSNETWVQQPADVDSFPEVSLQRERM
jgi:exopolysaccharide production protein ExoQ